jgi:hypothetical protein
MAAIKRRAGTLAAAAFLILAAATARAELENENLLVTLPPGYKVDFQQNNDKMMISEMVPSAENVNAWTEMVTVQVFFGLKIAPEQFRARMEKLWSGSCANSQFNTVDKGVENGYPALVWIQNCPLNKQTGKPEITWFKAVRGNDSLYLVQKAFKFMPSEEQVTTWMQYLRGVAVCDSRRPDRACPKTTP